MQWKIVWNFQLNENIAKFRGFSINKQIKNILKLRNINGFLMNSK